MNSLRLCAYTKLVLFGIAAMPAQFGWADCECPRGSVEQAILKADRIFRGEVVSASITDDSAQTIEFVIEVDEAIRGITEPRYRLTTQRPDSCGVPVRLGFHDMYVLGPGETNVSSCSGSGRAVYLKFPLLPTAIALVDLPVSDTSGAQRLLTERLYSSYPRADVEEFFALVEKIDPTGNAPTGFSDRIEYRGIAVRFKDDKYETVEVL